LRNDVSHVAQIIVGEPFSHGIHHLNDTEPFSKHEELDHDIKRRLRAEGGHLGLLRLALLTMTGKAWRELLRERSCCGWQRCQSHDEHHHPKATHRHSHQR
jgi:hypothetical protein